MWTLVAFKYFMTEWTPLSPSVSRKSTPYKETVFIAQIDRPTADPSPPGSRYLPALSRLCEFVCFRKSIAVRSCDTLISFPLSLEAFSALMYLNTTPPPALLQNLWQCILGGLGMSYKSVRLCSLCYITFFLLGFYYFFPLLYFQWLSSFCLF